MGLRNAPLGHCGSPECPDCAEDHPTFGHRLCRAREQVGIWWQYRDELPSALWNYRPDLRQLLGETVDVLRRLRANAAGAVLRRVNPDAYDEILRHGRALEFVIDDLLYRGGHQSERTVEEVPVQQRDLDAVLQICDRLNIPWRPLVQRAVDDLRSDPSIEAAIRVQLDYHAKLAGYRP